MRKDFFPTHVITPDMHCLSWVPQWAERRAEVPRTRREQAPTTGLRSCNDSASSGRRSKTLCRPMMPQRALSTALLSGPAS